MDSLTYQTETVKIKTTPPPYNPYPCPPHLRKPPLFPFLPFPASPSLRIPKPLFYPLNSLLNPPASPLKDL